jgi:hypothetical protein
LEDAQQPAQVPISAVGTPESISLPPSVPDVFPPSSTSVATEDRYASALMIVYNEYSTTPQRLIKNTRFESSSGLVFRIAETVEIPGYTVSDTSMVPGTVSVRVYADEPDPIYLIGPGDFTIPGFEGLPQEGKLYGRTYHSTNY